ncbi:transposase family protein [Streptomyces sp. ISL-87]|nr:transposase family protein [Streptomyces sp. ISL-21]MBT2608415.1 transposase family protein [Streptomyces sp. ISL-87]
MPSSLIDALARHREDVGLPCPLADLRTLAQVLDAVPDPRRVRGRRYRIGSLLALCLVAVLGGARSVTAIARFAADGSSELRERLSLTSTTPNTTTLGRLLARLDGDALDDAVGAWLGRYATDPVDEPGDTLRGLAVDGKAVRGSSRTTDHTPSTPLPCELISPGTHFRPSTYSDEVPLCLDAMRCVAVLLSAGRWTHVFVETRNLVHVGPRLLCSWHWSSVPSPALRASMLMPSACEGSNIAMLTRCSTTPLSLGLS